jgi:nicotinate-nucleotide adenylyltransferase
MTICLFGGSFDPVHKGHIHFAELVIKSFNLDAFYFIPTYFSPFKAKNTYAEDVHRLHMLQLACKHIDKAQVSNIEIERKGLSYTIDTLKTFHDIFPKHQLLWVIGDDHLPTLEKWRSYPEHFTYCDFIILPRNLERASTLIDQHPYKKQLHLLNIDRMPISSTEIRNAIKNDQAILSYVTPEINEYIHSNKLYR